MAMTTPTMKLRRAVVFSNFPLSLFENSLRPGLLSYGIDAVRVIQPDRSNDPDISDVDLVVLMVELMSDTKRKELQFLADRYKKTCVSLTRKKSEWSRKLTPLKPAPAPAVSTIFPTPPLLAPICSIPEKEAEPEPVETTDAQLLADAREIILLYEEDNMRLSSENKELVQKHREAENLASGLDQQVELLERKVATLEAAPKTIVGFDVKTLMALLKDVVEARKGNPASFMRLLEQCVKVGIKSEELLALLKE